MKNFFSTLKKTAKSFFYSSGKMPTKAPFVHDPIDIKRIMTLVVISLLPATFFAIINSGALSTIYKRVDIPLMTNYLESSASVLSYYHFLYSHFAVFFFEGCKLFIPQLLLIYLTGGIIELIFASIRKKEVSEGFFVTGILFALILPPTLPYWMTVFGVITGLILGKEVFGGTGMNIFNPALVCRCILYFSFPSYMTGNIWVGSNQFAVAKNVIQYNQQLHPDSYDTITTASPLNLVELSSSMTRLQIDATALAFTKDIGLKAEVAKRLSSFNKKLSIDKLYPTDHIKFLTAEMKIPEEQLENAFHFAKLLYKVPPYNDVSLYFGNLPGSFGETSKIAIHIGALLLLLTGLISFRIIVPAMLAALFTAGCFFLYAMSGVDTPANFSLPPYKQLIIGGLSFGIIFMATDPVSSPTTKAAQIIYGSLIGSLTILIRLINPAFPEGIMLAILFGNSFAPLLDRMILSYRKKGIKGKVVFQEGSL